MSTIESETLPSDRRYGYCGTGPRTDRTHRSIRSKSQCRCCAPGYAVRNDRRMLANMGGHMLDDIGLTPGDIDKEVSKYFWQN